MPIDYIPYLRKMVSHAEILSVGLSCLIITKDQKVLLEKRSDNGLFCLPGGSIDLYETAIEGVKREVFEETGIELKAVSLFAVFSGEKMKISYPNGDVTHYVDLNFLAYLDEEVELKKDQESISIFFVPLNDLPKREEFLNGSYLALEKYLRGDFSVTVD